MLLKEGDGDARGAVWVMHIVFLTVTQGLLVSMPSLEMFFQA